MRDTRIEELEAEYFAGFDYLKSMYSALDPDFEIKCDDYAESTVYLPVIQPEYICDSCSNPPF